MTSRSLRRGRSDEGRSVDHDLVDHQRLAQMAADDLARTFALLAFDLLAAVVAWPHHGHLAVVAWALGAMVFPVAMVVWTRAYRRDPAAHHPERWEWAWVRVCAASSTWTGLWWVAFAPFDTMDRTVLVVILAVAISIGAAGSSASVPGFLAFTGPGNLLLVAALLRTGGPWTLMGVLGFPLGASVLVFQLESYRRLVDQIRDRLQLELLADRQDLIFETVAEPLVITVDGVIEDGNQHFADLVGERWEALRGRALLDLVDAEGTEAVSPDGSTEPFPDGDPTFVVLHRADGTSVTAEVRGGTLAGHPGHQVWTCRDVTARLADERALRRLVDHDHLTGVLNRRALASRLDDVGTEAGRTTGILIIDLDGFKAVNDRYGHQVGDRMLEAVADRIAKVVRGTALVGRLGGDEFMVLAHDLRRPADLERVAARVCDACREPVRIGSLTVAISASVGLSISRGPRGADEAVAEADEHMYEAKRSGGDRWVGASSSRG